MLSAIVAGLSVISIVIGMFAIEIYLAKKIGAVNASLNIGTTWQKLGPKSEKNSDQPRSDLLAL
jgi:hypothetical protein